MDNWFTIEQIDRDTFSISEYKHWEETHCYLLCGEKYAILIDTGLGVSNIRKIVDSLTKLPVMTVTTHVHWDHIGGHKYFDNIAVHEAEKDWLSVRFPIPLQVVKNNLTRIPCDFPRDFDINAYQIFQGIPQRILHDGDFLNLGGREIQVVHTLGHSPGHCCFYEPERNYLYSGDLIYKGSLDAFYPTTDPKLFYQSIRRIRKYNIKKVLPGHHQLDIPVSLIADIEAGFAQLERAGKLKQGMDCLSFRISKFIYNQSCRCRNNHSHNGSFHFHGLRRKFIPDCFISGDFLNSFFKRLRSSCESRLYLSRNALQNISVNC